MSVEICLYAKCKWKWIGKHIICYPISVRIPRCIHHFGHKLSQESIQQITLSQSLVLCFCIIQQAICNLCPTMTWGKRIKEPVTWCKYKHRHKYATYSNYILNNNVVSNGQYSTSLCRYTTIHHPNCNTIQYNTIQYNTHSINTIVCIFTSSRHVITSVGPSQAATLQLSSGHFQTVFAYRNGK